MKLDGNQVHFQIVRPLGTEQLAFWNFSSSFSRTGISKGGNLISASRAWGRTEAQNETRSSNGRVEEGGKSEEEREFGVYV